VRLDLSPDDLRPIVEAVVAEVLKHQAELDAKLGERLGYSEGEAAGLLGMAPHRLRDCRLRGEIHAKLIGRSYVYSRAALLKFLEASA